MEKIDSTHPRTPAAQGSRSGPQRWRVTKKLLPGQPGTLRLARRFGMTLLCVRYRLDASGSRRLTTVELVVEDTPASRRAERMVALQVQFNELELRADLLQRGARWDRVAKVWRLPRRLAVAMGLRDRIVDK